MGIGVRLEDHMCLGNQHSMAIIHAPSQLLHAYAPKVRKHIPLAIQLTNTSRVHTARFENPQAE